MSAWHCAGLSGSRQTRPAQLRCRIRQRREIEPAEADRPVAVIALGPPNPLAAQSFGQINPAIAPFDVAFDIHAPDMVVGRILPGPDLGREVARRRLIQCSWTALTQRL